MYYIPAFVFQKLGGGGVVVIAWVVFPQPGALSLGVFHSLFLFRDGGGGGG